MNDWINFSVIKSMKIDKSIIFKNPELVDLEFVPIRLGKRHMTYFMRPNEDFLRISRNSNPYFWEYQKDKKREHLSDQDNPIEKDITTLYDLSSGIIKNNLNHFGRLGSVWFDENDVSHEIASLLSGIPFGQKMFILYYCYCSFQIMKPNSILKSKLYKVIV